MRVSRFYLDAKLAEGECLLEDNLAHYVGRVLRLAPGAPVQIFNGSGQEWPGEVLAVGKREVRVRLDAAVPGLPESPLRVNALTSVRRIGSRLR